MAKLITINIDEKALATIDEASKKDNPSRSNFFEVAGLEKANNILGGESNAK